MDSLGHHNGRGSGFDAPAAHSHERQTAVNESWPKNAADQRAWPDRVPIPVRVRVVFERDGETWIDGLAIRWRADSPHVCVTTNDRRVSSGYLWVDAGDVERR